MKVPGLAPRLAKLDVRLRAVLMVHTSLMVALLLAACGGSKADATQYVGKVEGSDAFIAIVVSDDGIGAYICDGSGTNVTVSAWFSAPRDGQSFDLRSRTGEQLKGELAGKEVRGTFVGQDGRELAFQATKATGEAGLYRVTGEDASAKFTAGWVVLADGEQRGSLGFEPGGGLGVAPLAVAPLIQPRTKSVMIPQISLPELSFSKAGISCTGAGCSLTAIACTGAGCTH